MDSTKLHDMFTTGIELARMIRDNDSKTDDPTAASMWEQLNNDG